MTALIQQSAAVWQLVRRQHGVIAHDQLIALGYSPAAIKHRIAAGRLHPLWRGVYAVGRPEVSADGRRMAAVLACGEWAYLSHRSAAALWEMLPERGSAAIDVSLMVSYARRHRGIAVHRRVGLTADDLTTCRGIPVTTPVCTLIDIACALSRDLLETAINEGDKRDLFDPESLRDALEHVRPRPGVGVLRKTLDRRTFTMTDTQLERRFLPIARRAGLPKPETQAWVNGFRVDFHWPELRLVVETDGLRYHRTPAQQAEDRVRDQTHTAAGLTALRFTRAQVRYEPRYVEAILRKVAAGLRSAGSSGPRRPRAASGGRPSR